MHEFSEISKKNIMNMMPVRIQDSHKGSYGSVLNIAGSKNYRGAAFLSSIAPLKVGAGFVTLAGIEEVINSVSSMCSEVVFFRLNSTGKMVSCSALKQLEKVIDSHSVISVGCGLGAIEQNISELKDFIDGLIHMLKDTTKSVIFDADALNTIAELDVKKLPENSILTPHPKELARLLKMSTDEIQSDRTRYAQFAAQKFSSIVVLKGHNTIISNGISTYTNKNANSALAKAGTGDVLTGVIAGLCAQGLSPIDAAAAGVYLHGIAGKLAAKELTQYGVLASDLLKYIPLAIKDLFTPDEN